MLLYDFCSKASALEHFDQCMPHRICAYEFQTFYLKLSSLVKRTLEDFPFDRECAKCVCQL